MSKKITDKYEAATGSNFSEALILEHLPLVKRIAVHLRARVPRFMEFDELIQAGMMGLIKAARSYDASKGVAFEGFATIRIKGAMLDEVRRMSYLPRSAVAINRSHDESASELSSRLGRLPSSSELAEFMGKESDDMERERGEAQRFETTSIENMPEVIQNIAEDESQRPDMLMEQSQMHEALENAIAALPERDQLIVSLYYVDELNLREIGETIGVSEARVSQLLSAIAKTLRKSLQFKLKIFGRY